MDLSNCDPYDNIETWAKIEQAVNLKPLDDNDLLLPSDIPRSEKLRFVCLSDTHGKHEGVSLPEDVDVLLHTGDITMWGLRKEIQNFNEWIGTLSCRHKIVIAGNHDAGLERLKNKGLIQTMLSNCTYLEDEEITIGGYKIYGSPWVPQFGSSAFAKSRKSLKHTCDEIPSDTDILITHGPPLGILDHCESGARAGCMYLLDAVINRVKPKFHIFGHIHEARGFTESKLSGTKFINASNCTIHYRPSNEPVIFEVPIKQSAW